MADEVTTAAALVREMMAAILKNHAGPREVLRACAEVAGVAAHLIITEEKGPPRPLN